MHNDNTTSIQAEYTEALEEYLDTVGRAKMRLREVRDKLNAELVHASPYPIMTRLRVAVPDKGYRKWAGKSISLDRLEVRQTLPGCAVVVAIGTVIRADGSLGKHTIAARLEHMEVLADE